MIKHLFTTLCALALITAGSIPALAAEADTSESARYYPISVEEYTYEEQNEPRINKVYQLSLSDNPSGIPTKDFVRNGRLYYLLDMTRKDEVGVDTKPHTETVTRPSDTSNMEEILQGLEAELEVTTEEGYTGVLRLDHTSVQVTTDGYGDGLFGPSDPVSPQMACTVMLRYLEQDGWTYDTACEKAAELGLAPAGSLEGDAITRGDMAILLTGSLDYLAYLQTL